MNSHKGTAVCSVLSELIDRNTGPFLDRRDGTSYSYEEVAEEAARIGSFLRKHRIQRGDTVALAMENSPEACILWFGLLREGVAIVPLNPILPDEEISYILRMAEVKMLVADTRFADSARRWCEEVPSRCEMILAGDAPWKRYSAADRSYVDPDDIAVIFFTSGTTGRPKGAMLTHKALLANVRGCAETFALDSSAAFASPIPIFHSFAATVCLFLPAFLGGRVFFHSPRELDAFLQGLSSLESPRIVVAVPSLLEGIFSAIPALPNCRFIVSGGAALLPELRRKIEDGGNTIFEGYGTTECGPVIASQNPSAPGRPGSVGKPISGVKVSIRSSSDDELPAGTTGEIVVQTPALMAGYYDLAQATRASIKGGWFHTGDLGYINDTGELFIVDRLTDVVTVKGISVLPQTVEAVLLKHPAVAEAAVVGIPDGAGGEIPWAFARAKEKETTTDPSEILSFCREHLPIYAVPRGLEFRDSLPKTITGKVLKRTLRQKWL